MQTMHQGGVFSTRALDRESDDARSLGEIHKRAIGSLGLISGVTHTEFIKSHPDGTFYFLETAARVGGAHIADVVEFASGINPWVEWARIEVASLLGMEYALPNVTQLYAGSIICLSRQERPDTGSYAAPEVVKRLDRHHHAGLILRSSSAERIEDLVAQYSDRFLHEFCAFEPPPAQPTA